MMMGVSFVMYTTSYIARDCKFYRKRDLPMIGTSCFVCLLVPELSLTHSINTDKNIQHKHEIQEKALAEYYEKHGGSPGHH